MVQTVKPGQIYQQTQYHKLGGESGVRRLVDTFYEVMDSLESAQTIRGMHPQDLGQSREKLFLFLSGWLGGPELYIEKFGHPRMRGRHAPFAIGEAERDQWLLCMQTALQQMGVEDAVQKELMQAFHNIADFMRNRE